MGNDANSGLLPHEAWATLARANSQVFSAGDSLLLRRGDVFRGTLHIRQSGDPDRHIYIGAYGEGAKPVILGAEPIVNDWASTEINGVSAWITSYSRVPSFLYYAGKDYHVARMPDGFNVYYYTYWPDLYPPGAHVGAIRSRQLIGFPEDITGAYISVRRNGWLCDTRIVSGFSASSGQTNLSSAIIFDGIQFDSTGFILSNHIAFLNRPGEFYYRPDGGQLWMITDGAQPQPDEVEASVHDFGIFMDTSVAVPPGQTGLGYLTFENLAFRFQAIAGIALSPKCQHITIRHCSFDALPFGITATQIDKGNKGDMQNAPTYNLTIEHNDFKDTYRAAINAALSANLIMRCNVVCRAHLIVNAAEWLRLPNQPYGAHTAAIECKNSQGGLIEYNRVDSCGHYGITVSSSCIARYNIVKNTCPLYADCGGIYCAYESDVVIEKNIVENVWHNDNAFPGHGDVVNGIYFDYNRKVGYRSIILRGNTLIRAGVGIGGWAALMLSQGHILRPKIYVEDNVSYGNRTWSFGASISIAGPILNPPPGGNAEFRGNKWVGFNKQALWYWKNENNNNSHWKSDSNYYFNPYHSIKICTHRQLGRLCYILPQWQALGYDVHSRANFTEVNASETRPPEVLFPIFVNETQERQHILLAPKCYLNLDSQQVGPVLMLEPFCSEVLVLQDDCALLCPEPDTLEARNISDTAAVLYWSPVTAAHAYVVRFRPAADTTWVEHRIDATQITEWHLAGLSPKTGYVFTVQTICDTTGLFASGPSEEQMFFTQDTASGLFSPLYTPCPPVRVWPNPSTGGATLHLQNPDAQLFLLAIMSMDGRVIRRQYTREEQVNLYDSANLAPGIYLYQLTGTDCASTGLFTVK